MFIKGYRNHFIGGSSLRDVLFEKMTYSFQLLFFSLFSSTSHYTNLAKVIVSKYLI